MKQFTLAAFADEAGSDVEVQIRALQENGVPCLEIRGVGDKNITALTVDEAKELKKRLDDAGISVWSIGSPLGKISVGDEFAPHLDTFKHTLELSRVLGAGNIRMFSFFCPKGEAAYCRDIVFERLHQFCAAAQGSGITLCHENEKGIYGDTADRCPISGNGGGLEIGFNNKYLMDALKAAPADKLRMEFTSGVAPCVILPAEGEEKFIYMVLPVRLKAN